MDRGHANDGGVRRRRMAARTARTIGPVTATSANWKVMARAWRTTRAPILNSLICRLVNDQSAMASGSSVPRRKVARLRAERRRVGEESVRPCCIQRRTYPLKKTKHTNLQTKKEEQIK